MTSISMCSNSECVISDFCYRKKAKPSAVQSFADFKPYENGYCDYWIPIAYSKSKCAFCMREPKARSIAGWNEWLISGICEPCFDEATKGVDDD